MTPQEISDKFEQLIGEGKMKWEKPDKSTLEQATIWYLDIFDKAKLDCMVGHIKFGKALVISLDSEVVPYFEHHPEERVHQWPDSEYEECLDNNKCFLHLMKLCYPNLKEEKALKLFEVIELEESFSPGKFQTEKEPWEEGYVPPVVDYDFLHSPDEDEDDGEEQWTNGIAPEWDGT